MIFRNLFSSSGLKCLIRPWTGQAAPSARAQMVWPSICLLVHDNDCRCPETCLLCHQVVKVHQNFVTNRLGDEGSGAASRDDTEQVVPAADHSAAVALDQLLQGDAHLLLHRAGVVHVARDVEQLGAGVPGAAHAGEPVSSPPADGR